MNIVVVHVVDKNTGGNYFRKALGKSHDINYLSERPQFITKNDSGLPIQEILHDREVDLLLFIDPVGNSFPIGLEKMNCPTAIYLVDVHQNLEQRLQLAYFFDYVFIAQKDYLPVFQENGITNSFWLPLACEPEIHQYSATQEERVYDIGFVGNRGLIGSQRRKLLDTLQQNFKVNDLSRKYSSEEIGSIYSQSYMVFNCAVNHDVNMRVFEALCSGRLLLTNAIPNGLEELFEDRKHLVIYRNLQELIKLAHYYLHHPNEREAIAKAGQAEVLTKHTYQHRTEQILTTIFGYGKPKLVAPIRTWSAKKRWQAYTQVLVNLRQPLAVLRVIFQAYRQGEFSWSLVVSGVKATLRAVNQRVPLTPNALRNRWRALVSNL
jgi:Glycosyl transferases group 1/DUF based on E. rectale Gene description (DUF3880)